MADQNQEANALLELERRAMSGDPAITPDVKSKIDEKLRAYRQQGLVKPLGGTKVLSSADRKQMEGGIDSYSALKNSLGSFTDDFAGNAITGGLENSIQSISSSFGTPGQRDWWSNLRATDNQIRNDLFGSALTDTEKRAYEETTISERMDPKIIKQNLSRRAEIIRGALARRTDYFKKAGYDAEAIDALTGQYGADLTPDYKPPETQGGNVPDTKKQEMLGTLVPTDVANKIEESGLTKEQQDAYDAFNRANPNATPDQLRAFAKSMGMGDLENAEDIVKARDQGGGVMPGATGIVRPPDISDVRGEGGVAEGARAAVRGVGDVVSFGSLDRALAAGETLLGDGTMRENLARQRAIDDYDEEYNALPRFGGQLVGGLILPVGRAAKTAGELAKLGGATGALYGYNSSEDWGLSGIKDAALGGASGAALGFGAGKLFQRLGRGRGPDGPGGLARDDTEGVADQGLDNLPTGGSGDMIDVATRLNIKPSPATVGGRLAEGTQIGLGNLPGSMGPVRSGVEREVEALSAAARDAAGRMGEVATPSRAGEIISRGAKVADRAQAREAGRSYKARTKMMGGDNAPVTMGGTQTTIRNIGGDFASNEVVGDLLTHPLVRKLEGADASELTLGESTELLSEARRVLNRARQTKQPGRLIGQLRELEGAIEGDVMRAAQASDAIAGREAGQGAVAAQREGDRLWADRMDAQRKELKRALSSATDNVNTSSESVYRQMFTDMAEEGGNLTRLRRTLDRLPKRARDTFSATAFDDLGKAKPSAQNAEGDAWSFETFMTNWGKMSPQARKEVFGGRGVDREINDIVRYADRLRTLNKARNFSNTAGTAAQGGFVGAIVTTLFAGGPVAAAGVASLYPGMNAIGRTFMATPALRAWTRSALQAASRGNESQARNLVRRLPTLAAKNPVASAEIAQIEQRLLQAMNDNMPAQSAASGGEQKKEGR